ncbi:metallophosphoesterase family protein [Tellurirhabdus bombi]|uniref:metallophosphoesterase family protein n=1 Tax=Tellurirhabdus bombi TaxID=2907205 RepID=UPI001F48ED72|nr:metallophosphoesterase [Tellurirhabdus bombi]
MRIAFLTDLHIGTENQHPQGVDIRQNFLDALHFLTEMKPDCLVIGGDVCYQQGDREIYRWVLPHLDALGLPYYVISGNHDDSVLLAEEFRLGADLHGQELYFSRVLDTQTALFLDTARGYCSETQWEWLETQLKSLEGNLLVFMHHPPLLADVKYMDINYPFQQRDRLMTLLKSAPGQVTVVCGHYHAERLILVDNVRVLVTPSLFFQMKHDPVECIIEHYRMGIRELNLFTDRLTSTLHYLEGNRTSTK